LSFKYVPLSTSRFPAPQQLTSKETLFVAAPITAPPVTVTNSLFLTAILLARWTLSVELTVLFHLPMKKFSNRQRTQRQKGLDSQE